MKTIITEKPSVAREIAYVLGATEKKDGYFTGTGYYITWAFGHLIGVAMPEDYGLSGFEKTNLPILPDPFLLTVRKVKKDNKYITDSGALKQLKIIEKLLDKSESIIVATDAGREGELIFRQIYAYLKCTKPFQRLWISSLTEKAIKQGFENLKEGNAFDGLYYAAQGRSRSDWLVGINATQALSIAVGNGMYSLGRVQTPTLALICKRFLDNRSFEVSNYWQIELLFNKDFIEFKGSSQIKWNEQNAAIDSLKSIQRNGKVTITSIENGNLTEQAPLLFDLTGLQKEANKKLNLTAEDTLNITQSLYEKKFITYPRTGSKHIPEDMWDEIPKLLRALQEHEKYKLEVSKLKWGRFNKRIVNDLRVTDHHGLLITDKTPSALSAKETAIYNLIVLRLLEALSPSCIKEITEVNLEVLHYDFTIKGVKIVDVGWRAIKGSLSEDDSELLQHLPNLKVGDELKIKKALMLEKQTKPPMLYTEASLLSEMENAGNTIENDEARKILKNIGIGTPATRASIIETLFKRNYIERQKKALLPTQKGLFVYHKVKNMKIVDVALTAEWEIQFEKIEIRKLNPNTFQKEIEVLTKSITEELLQTSTIQKSQPKLTCPKCKTNHLLIRDHIVKCSDELCNWVQFRNICGIQLTINNIEALISKGKTGLLKGMKSKSGKIFSAFIILNANCKTSFEFV